MPFRKLSNGVCRIRPCTWCVACKNIEAVETLLLAQRQQQAAGTAASATTTDAKDANAMARTTPLWLAMEYQDNNNNNNNNNNNTEATVAIVAALLEHGASPHVMRHGTTLLHQAAAASPSETVKLCQLFIQYGADVHRRNSTCETVLQVAAMKSNPALIEMLLRAGASISPRNPEVRISLRACLQQGSSRQSLLSLSAFLENGVNPNTFGGDGMALLHWAVKWIAFPAQPHSLATTNSDDTMTTVKRVLELLMTFGANIDLPERQAPHETPLIMACRKGGSLVWVEALLEAGASVHCQNSLGQTCLMALMQAPPTHRMIWQRLLQTGANSQACRDARGRTLWHTASVEPKNAAWLHILRPYMDPSVNATLADCQGQTPLHVAGLSS
eukprot:scaffold3772_cov171-Amphora_coffeaeformis.AAC.1